MPQHHESVLEAEICDHLAAHGWQYSPDDSSVDRYGAAPLPAV
ncbi:hypothetical protein ABTW96_04695 [Nocardia beijingensis]